MGNFNRDDRRGGGGGGRNFGGGGRGFGGRDGGRPMMHQATCSKCNKSCEIPFKPTGDRPVFCNDCFRAQGQGRGDRHQRPEFGRSNFDDQQKQRIGGGQNIEQFRSQFEVLNVKLDKILKALMPAAAVTANPEAAEVKEKKEKKVKKVVAKKKK